MQGTFVGLVGVELLGSFPWGLDWVPPIHWQLSWGQPICHMAVAMPETHVAGLLGTNLQHTLQLVRATNLLFRIDQQRWQPQSLKQCKWRCQLQWQKPVQRRVAGLRRGHPMQQLFAATGAFELQCHQGEGPGEDG